MTRVRQVTSQRLIDRLEEVEARLVDEHLKLAGRLDELFGGPPYGQERLSEHDQALRVAEIWDDPVAWKKLLDENGDTPVAEYAVRAVKLKQKFPDLWAAAPVTVEAAVEAAPEAPPPTPVALPAAPPTVPEPTPTASPVGGVGEENAGY